MQATVSQFLKNHRLRSKETDMEELATKFAGDMELGLSQYDGSLKMIPTYIAAENEYLTDVPVLAIDAGGTHFRAAKVRIRKSGKADIEDLVNHPMPGLNGEIGSREFFATIASYIEKLAGSVERIGFCFSYPTEILPDRDGRLIKFCKEVRAPEVHGMLIGRNLLDALGTPGKRIVLLNDTVATLLAGKSVSAGKSYSSYIGFILGTGTNTCYIESNAKILKNGLKDSGSSQIINIESGDFGRPPRSELDILFDNTTANPGNYKFEKMFSGGYFGNLVLFVLQMAAKDGIFSENTASVLPEISELSSSEASEFMSGENPLKNILSTAVKNESDTESCRIIIENLIDRAARLVAASLGTVVLRTGKGLDGSAPVLITVEGTAFYNLHEFRLRFEKYFSGFLDGSKKRYTEFTSVNNSSLIGAALAGLIIQDQ
jgi:hexokinase